MLVDEKLDMIQPCALPAQKGRHVLDFTKSSVGSRASEGFFSPLLCSDEIPPGVQLWGPPDRRDTDLSEQV